MRLAALGFALGVWHLQRQPVLPETGWLAFAACAALAALAAAGYSRRTGAVVSSALGLAGFAVLGFVWAGAFAHQRLSDRLDPALEGRDVVLTGVIAGLPQALERGVRFDFDVESSDPGVPQRVALSWYGGPPPDESQEVRPVRAGERWRFTVRLRRPHGSTNPHGFDYEAWLLERGLRATGYVRQKGERERLSERVPGYRIERLRESVREKFRAALPERPLAGVLVALAIGEQRAIDTGQWQLFARTGVSHLMSISGLHVTMVSGLFAMLVSWGWRRSERLALALPAQKAAALAGFLAAFS